MKQERRNKKEKEEEEEEKKKTLNQEREQRLLKRQTSAVTRKDKEEEEEEEEREKEKEKEKEKEEEEEKEKEKEKEKEEEEEEEEEEEDDASSSFFAPSTPPLLLDKSKMYFLNVENEMLNFERLCLEDSSSSGSEREEESDDERMGGGEEERNGVVRRSDTIDVVLIEGAEEEERNGVVVRRRVAVDVVLIEGAEEEESDEPVEVKDLNFAEMGLFEKLAVLLGEFENGEIEKDFQKRGKEWGCEMISLCGAQAVRIYPHILIYHAEDLVKEFGPMKDLNQQGFENFNAFNNADLQRHTNKAKTGRKGKKKGGVGKEEEGWQIPNPLFQTFLRCWGNHWHQPWHTTKNNPNTYITQIKYSTTWNYKK